VFLVEITRVFVLGALCQSKFIAFDTCLSLSLSPCNYKAADFEEDEEIKAQM